MRENFTNSIGSRSKVISFYDESEFVARKYFLKLLGMIYAEKTGSEIAFLPNRSKSIKLVYQKPNSLQIQLNIGVKFERGNVIFDVKNSEELFNRYLVKSLSGVRYEYFERSALLSFAFERADQIELLENILNFRDHLTYSVNFTFNAEDFAAFRRRLEIVGSPSYHRRFSMLASLLEEHFETLGCSSEDDFETVRSSYLQLTKMYHPDLHGEKQGYTDKFQKISVAYEALKPFFKEQDNYILQAANF